MAARRSTLLGRALTAGPAPKLDPGGATSLLRTLRQGHTQWSVVYDLKAGTAAVATGQRRGPVGS